LGKRTSIERFFGRVFGLFSFYRLQRPPPMWLVSSGAARGLDLYGDHRRGFSRKACWTSLSSFAPPHECWRICGNLTIGIRNVLRNACETGAWYPGTRRVNRPHPGRERT
jgi:hypothetical protein